MALEVAQEGVSVSHRVLLETPEGVNVRMQQGNMLA